MITAKYGSEWKEQDVTKDEESCEQPVLSKQDGYTAKVCNAQKDHSMAKVTFRISK